MYVKIKNFKKNSIYILNILYAIIILLLLNYNILKF